MIFATCRRRPPVLALALVAAIAQFARVVPANAAILFSETFDIDVADESTFNSTYPAFTTTLSGTSPTLEVIGGVVEAAGDSTTASITVPGFDEDIIITADIGAENSNGSYNVGLQIGSTNYVFHPGFTTIPGAFRIESGQSNTDMGFVPANGTLHQMQIVQFHDTGLMEITITDGDNPSNVFTASINKPGDVGGAIGFRRSGSTAFAGLYDNLVIQHAAAAAANNDDTIFISSLNEFQPVVLSDAIEIANTGLANSGLEILSFSLGGPDAGRFTIPDFAPIELFAGATETERFDLQFTPLDETRAYFATLTIMTNVGDLVFELQGTLVPEPSTISLCAFGTLAMVSTARRRRRRRRIFAAAFPD